MCARPLKASYTKRYRAFLRTGSSSITAAFRPPPCRFPVLFPLVDRTNASRLTKDIFLAGKETLVLRLA